MHRRGGGDGGPRPPRLRGRAPGAREPLRLRHAPRVPRLLPPRRRGRRPPPAPGGGPGGGRGGERGVRRGLRLRRPAGRGRAATPGRVRPVRRGRRRRGARRGRAGAAGGPAPGHPPGRVVPPRTGAGLLADGRVRGGVRGGVAVVHVRRADRGGGAGDGDAQPARDHCRVRRLRGGLRDRAHHAGRLGRGGPGRREPGPAPAAAVGGPAGGRHARGLRRVPARLLAPGPGQRRGPGTAAGRRPRPALPPGLHPGRRQPRALRRDRRRPRARGRAGRSRGAPPRRRPRDGGGRRHRLGLREVAR